MLRRSSLIFALLLALGMLPAYAFTGNTIHTMIPFPFIVAGKTLPAGRYELVQVDPRQDNQWLIRNLGDDSKEAIFDAEQENAFEPKLDTYVAFEEIHQRHYLSDIWTAGTVDGWHVPVEAESSLASSVKPKMHKVEATTLRSEPSK